MIVELNETEVLNALKTQFSFPIHATMTVTVGRKENSSKFTICIPTLDEVTVTDIKPTVVTDEEEVSVFS